MPMCFTNSSPNCCYQGKLNLFLQKSNTVGLNEKWLLQNVLCFSFFLNIKSLSNLTRSEWNALFHSKLSSFIFTFWLALLEVMTHSWSCEAAEESSISPIPISPLVPSPWLSTDFWPSSRGCADVGLPARSLIQTRSHLEILEGFLSTLPVPPHWDAQ